MSTSFDQIALTPEQKRHVVQLSEQTGMPWDEVLDSALAAYHPHVGPGSKTEAGDVIPTVAKDNDLRHQDRFEQLAQAWMADTTLCSSTTEISTHPAYQQIIGMGSAALPLIFAELRKAPGHWFWALKAITGDDPVAAADRGNLVRMSAAWLRWAEANGYSPK